MPSRCLALIVLSMTSLGLFGQATRPDSGVRIMAFRWAATPKPEQERAMNDLLKKFGWRSSGNPLATRDRICIIEPDNDSAANRGTLLRDNIVKKFGEGIQGLNVQTLPSEVRILTGDVVVFLQEGTDVSHWIQLAKIKGAEVSQDADINDNLRVVIKKRKAKPGELDSIVASMPNVEKAEAKALVIQDRGIN
jgi:hypothetical protein